MEKTVKKTGKTARLKRIKNLNAFIWQLEGKCETISKVNEQLILQYCRFAVLADEMSIEISEGTGLFEQNDIENRIKLYEKYQKMALNLYKILKFDTIQKGVGGKENPFTKMLNDSQKDGDF